MTIQEIKRKQEEALAAFAYYTGALQRLGGTINEPDAPNINFPDFQDYKRLNPILQENWGKGYDDAVNGPEEVK